MWSTKRKAQNVYGKAEWHRQLDEKDKILAKDVFELWMAGHELTSENAQAAPLRDWKVDRGDIRAYPAIH